MLNDLKILNGNLELAFNEYTYEYTVVVDKEITSLDIDYKLDSGCSLSIRDNLLNNEENIVYIDVFNNEEFITYTFYVYKENSDTVSSIDNYMSSLEINVGEEVSLYKVQILTVSIFLLIVILFSVMFRRKRIK